MHENPFAIDAFFETIPFLRDSLFKNLDYAWQALPRLNDFFKKLSFKIESRASLCHIKNEESVSIGEDCEIEPFTVIEGPCWIGRGVTLRSHSYIRAGSIIGDEALIGHSSEVVRSIVLPRAKLPHFNYIGDSIIGEGVNLGAGAKCANLRLDAKAITFFYLGVKYETHLKKMGAIIGNRSQIGCNAVLNPGTIVFPESLILPCKEVRGVVGPNENVTRI